MIAPLIDTHCHLTYGALGKDAEGAWERAQAAGVRAAILVGIDPSSSEEIVRYTDGRPGLYAAVGIHPNAAGQISPGDAERIAALVSHPDVVAIGESGLDTHHKDAPLADQEEALAWHAELALAHDLPLILHLRDAFEEAERALAGFAERGGRAVVHCFAGETKDLYPFIDWGFAISLSGILTYPTAKGLRAAAQVVPEELLLVETDSPWLAPVPHRGQVKFNEPSYVAATAKCLAKLRGVSDDEIRHLTTRNAERIFGLQ